MPRSIAGSLLQWWEARKGTPTVRVVNVHQDPREGYLVKTTAGQIEIFCREVLHEIRYSKWWAPTKKQVMYQVYCACSSDMPTSLRLRLNEDYTVPRLLHPMAPRAAQKKAAIDSYMEMVVAHFRTAQPA